MQVNGFKRIAALILNVMLIVIPKDADKIHVEKQNVLNQLNTSLIMLLEVATHIKPKFVDINTN